MLVIHYVEDAETIFTRVKKKEREKGKRCAWYTGLDDRELLEHIRQVILSQREKISWLKKNQVPVVEIDSEIVNDKEKLKEIMMKITEQLSTDEPFKKILGT